MTRTMTLGVLIFAIAACAAEGEPAEEGAMGAGGDEASVVDEGGRRGATTSSLTWHFDSMENCEDYFGVGVTCNPGLPTPQCNVAEGQPCTQMGAWCYKVVFTNRYFRAYQCY